MTDRFRGGVIAHINIFIQESWSGRGRALDARPGSDSMISFSHVILMNFKKSSPKSSISVPVNVGLKARRPQLAHMLAPKHSRLTRAVWVGGTQEVRGNRRQRSGLDRQQLPMRQRNGTARRPGGVILVGMEGISKDSGQRQCQTRRLLFLSHCGGICTTCLVKLVAVWFWEELAVI